MAGTCVCTLDASGRDANTYRRSVRVKVNDRVWRWDAATRLYDKAGMLDKSDAGNRLVGW